MLSDPPKRMRARPIMAWDLADLTHEELLDVRMSDLGVHIQGTWLEELLDRVEDELAMQGLRFKPHFWLADEWFSPDGIPGVALPFYLAHPRLMRLERRMMFEVEGGTRTECMRLIRHEIGHAVQHAYRLERRRQWQRTFGLAGDAYPDFYRPNPMSKKYVQYLEGWYAQAHPVEDWAETFAVWLDPKSKWRDNYRGWPAFRKLEYLDALMGAIADDAPLVRSRRKPYSLSTLRHTLRVHYERRQDHYSPGYSEEYDPDLLKIFSAGRRFRRNETAASFLRRHRREIREQVAEFTGEYQFTLDQVLKEMIGRCKQLELRVTNGERKTKLEFAIMLTAHTVHLLHRRDEWHPL